MQFSDQNANCDVMHQSPVSGIRPHHDGTQVYDEPEQPLLPIPECQQYLGDECRNRRHAVQQGHLTVYLRKSSIIPSCLLESLLTISYLLFLIVQYFSKRHS